MPSTPGLLLNYILFALLLGWGPIMTMTNEEGCEHCCEKMEMKMEM